MAQPPLFSPPKLLRRLRRYTPGLHNVQKPASPAEPRPRDVRTANKKGLFLILRKYLKRPSRAARRTQFQFFTFAFPLSLATGTHILTNSFHELERVEDIRDNSR